MRIIDISMLISPDMAVYKGRAAKRPQHTIDARIPPDSVNESTLRLSLHTGTHIDSPFHMMADGWPTEHLPLDKLIAPAQVVDWLIQYAHRFEYDWELHGGLLPCAPQ